MYTTKWREYFFKNEIMKIKMNSNKTTHIIIFIVTCISLISYLKSQTNNCMMSTKPSWVQ